MLFWNKRLRFKLNTSFEPVWTGFIPIGKTNKNSTKNSSAVRQPEMSKLIFGSSWLLFQFQDTRRLKKSCVLIFLQRLTEHFASSPAPHSSRESGALEPQCNCGLCFSLAILIIFEIILIRVISDRISRILIHDQSEIIFFDSFNLVYTELNDLESLIQIKTTSKMLTLKRWTKTEWSLWFSETLLNWMVLETLTH